MQLSDFNSHGQTPGRPEIAAEFLRRNQHFRSDQTQLAHRVAMGKLTEADAQVQLARRWGVVFRRS